MRIRDGEELRAYADDHIAAASQQRCLLIGERQAELPEVQRHRALVAEPRALLRDKVREVLEDYSVATSP